MYLQLCQCRDCMLPVDRDLQYEVSMTRQVPEAVGGEQHGLIPTKLPQTVKEVYADVMTKRNV